MVNGSDSGLNSGPIAVGLVWEKLVPGMRFQTGRRTVSETDIVLFVGTMGFTEALFLDMDYVRHESILGNRRLAPGALTFCLAEGLIMQTNIIQYTGIAFLGAEIQARSPVFVEDTIFVDVEILASRATSEPGRGVVTSRNIVRKQDGSSVMEYTPSRLVHGEGWPMAYRQDLAGKDEEVDPDAG